MATFVHMQNQIFPIPDEIVALPDESEETKRQRDNKLKRWLSQLSPAASNASLQWSQENGDTVVRVTPQLGTKGGLIVDPVIEMLRAAPQAVPETLSLVVDLKTCLASGQLTLLTLLAYQERVARALDEGDREERLIGQCFYHLKEAKAVPSPLAPTGF